MKRRYAIPLLLVLCLVLVACVPKGGDVQAPTEDAAQRLQAVYDAIAGRWEKQEPLDCTVEVVGRESYRYHITPDNGYNVQNRSFDKYSLAWADADALEDPAGTALTFTSADGETSLRCWEDSGAVELRQNGETVWLVSAPDANGFTLFQNLLSIPEDAAMEEAWDVTVDGEVTDYEEVAQRYAQAVGERLMDLPDWHRSDVLGIQNIQGHVNSAYTGEPENFCGRVGYYFDLKDGNSPWQIGSGMYQVTSGPYAGYWDWGIGASFARNDNGDWYCTGTYTGGEDLVYPVRQEEATVEQLVDYFFHTTGEHAHLYRIPLELRRRGPEQLSALNDILDGYAQEKAQELCRVLGDHTKNWPDYEPVGYDELYALLKEPYRDWLLAPEAEGDILAVYQNALRRMLDEHIDVDGCQLDDAAWDWIGDVSFAVTDVDMDGTAELLTRYYRTTRVYQYDARQEEMAEELQGTQSGRFYSNGMVQWDSSHQTNALAGRFWPYDVEQYDARTDRYDHVGSVDAYDLETMKKVGAEGRYPKEVDAEGAGFVYYITDADGNGSDTPVSQSDYQAWYDSLFGGAEELTIDYLPLTHENIDALRAG